MLVPLVMTLMFVMIYLGLGRWWLALVVFFCILVSAAGGSIFLRHYGANLSVAVWVGFIALFGVADDAAVVILNFLEDAFKDRTPRSVAEIREVVVEASLTRVRALLLTRSSQWARI